ncbi:MULTISPECIES: hypothetical protein [Caproicibacterium]|uniref:Uncharacterized protein n=1 Tax=Caproicibacterium argilliputei TaxID=3030016 RepID=A0AA97DAS7_9FIRM|nr:hypothetical protein [Caproicibacterium argilliputei]WOC33476.1 hypothetical protein PXC00_06310 [Caproicibacterium argilliputei]
MAEEQNSPQTAETAPQSSSTATYTYNPAECQDGGLNQMRFELGDNVVEGQSMTAVLCDQEYNALISKYSRWKRAKLACLDAICMKLAYEVNTQVSNLSYSLNDRAERWTKMRDDMKKEVSVSAPCVAPSALSEPHYFYNDMLSNYRKRG